MLQNWTFGVVILIFVVLVVALIMVWIAALQAKKRYDQVMNNAAVQAIMKAVSPQHIERINLLFAELTTAKIQLILDAIQKWTLRTFDEVMTLITSINLDKINNIISMGSSFYQDVCHTNKGTIDLEAPIIKDLDLAKTNKLC
jgi:hypothetical protein